MPPRNPPDVRFASAPDGARIAYQVVGDGPRDLVLSTDWVSSIDLMWEQPRMERYLARLAGHGRLILFDKRGNGGSDHAPIVEGRFAATVEQAAEDLLAVLDAAGSERPDLISSTYGGWPAMLFAATHPERCGRLVLQDTCARQMAADDYAHGIDEETQAAVVDGLMAGHGRGAGLLGWDPALRDDSALRRWFPRYERLACDRAFIAEGWRRMGEIDLRAILPLIRTETLVIAHSEGCILMGAGSGAFLADHIADAQYVELPGHAAPFFGDERISDEIERFLGTEASVAGDDDRVLASVLFTDLVESTSMAARLGDQRWRGVLDDHDHLVDYCLSRFRGRLVKRTGDGILATFDGPARAVRCAETICRDARRLGVEVRAGVHAGEIELRGDDVGGIAVHLAARVMGQAGPGEVVVSRTVKDLTAGSGLSFEDRGTRELKGVPDPWQLFALAADPPPLALLNR
jgi:class 3 adenylate cyclase/pimeloyl-ACP methyl ester carboxylesterase